VRHVIAAAEIAPKFDDLPGEYTRIVVGKEVPGWVAYERGYAASAQFRPDGETQADDPFLLYFTSGTTATPKLVLHSHQSYPVGHLSTMYWIGLRPGDLHLNISSPGWAKHAWSCFFAPWNAGAAVFIVNQKPGSMGRPLPGYRVALLDHDGVADKEGEICLTLSPRPVGLMLGYQGDDREVVAIGDSAYRTGDVASLDDDGYLTYVGRADDVFKSSDYRISPFELESVLIEHPAIAEAAVVPSPDPMRLAVPKAFLALAPGRAPDRDTALSIFRHCRIALAPFKRVRRLEFADLPKTISGKIRRVELRRAEAANRGIGKRAALEFWEDDFSENELHPQHEKV
jgi:acetyl-CoA synthetase